MKTLGSLEKIDQKLCNIYQLDSLMSKCSIIVVHNSFILVYYDAGNMDMTSIKWKVH